MSETTTIVIAELEEKPGEKNGRKFTKHAIKDANGTWYSTFDAAVFAPARELVGKRAEVEYEISGQFKNLAAVRASESNGDGSDHVRAKENPSTQRSISASVALQQAVATVSHTVGQNTPSREVSAKVLQLASEYFRWLLQRSGLETDEDIPF